MKTWIIPVTWEMFGTMEIEAETLYEAYNTALDCKTPLPTNGEYILGSDLIDYSLEEVRDLFNNGEED